VVVVAIAAAASSSAGHDAEHAIVTALEIAAYVLASAAGLAVLGGLAYGARRWHRRVAAHRLAEPLHVVSVRVGQDRPRYVPAEAIAPASLALEAPRARPAAWPLAGQMDGAWPAGKDQRDAF